MSLLEEMVSKYSKVVKRKYKIKLDQNTIIGMVKKKPHRYLKRYGHQTRRNARRPNEYTVASAIIYHLRSSRTPISLKCLSTTFELKDKKLYKNLKLFMRDYKLKNIYPQPEDYLKVVSRQLALSPEIENYALKLCQMGRDAPSYCKAVSSVYVAMNRLGKKTLKKDFYEKVMVDKTSLNRYSVLFEDITV